jgi:hypothetical protein
MVIYGIEVGRIEVTQDLQQDPTHQQDQQSQPYDASFKGWIMQQAPAILWFLHNPADTKCGIMKGFGVLSPIKLCFRGFPCLCCL